MYSFGAWPVSFSRRKNFRLRCCAGLMALLYAYLGLFVAAHHTHGMARFASSSQSANVKTAAFQAHTNAARTESAAVSAPDTDCAACDFLASLVISPCATLPAAYVPPVIKIGCRPFAPRLPTLLCVCYSASRAPPATL